MQTIIQVSFGSLILLAVFGELVKKDVRTLHKVFFNVGDLEAPAVGVIGSLLRAIENLVENDMNGLFCVFHGIFSRKSSRFPLKTALLQFVASFIKRQATPKILMKTAFLFSVRLN